MLKLPPAAGIVPTMVKWVAVCKKAIDSFVVGDEIDLALKEDGNGDDYLQMTNNINIELSVS